jgi:putative transposase
MLSAILYVLRTGIQWNALPRELGASTTVYDRFRLWEEQGVFERIWQAGLQEYDELEGIAWEWQSMDGVMRHPPRIAWSRDRRQSHRSRQAGNQTQPIE